MINLEVKVKDLKSQIEIIQSFLDKRSLFSEKIANYFTGLENCFELQKEEKNQLIKEKITKFYALRLKDMEEKAKFLQSTWNEKSEFINNEFKNIFGREFNYDCTCYVNLNPVYPRYIDSKSFDVNLDVTTDQFLSACAHEIAHFAWFDVWKENFPNMKKRDRERPSLPWLISEIVVDPIFKFSGLKTLSKIRPAYSYFYEEKIGDRGLMEVVREMYKNNDLVKFQKEMYQMFLNMNTDYLIK
jgi:hypothetical protein